MTGVPFQNTVPAGSIVTLFLTGSIGGGVFWF